MSNEKVRDRKIDPKELASSGLVVDGVEILKPIDEVAQSQYRHKRKLPYYLLFGRVYYQQSELIEWVNERKVNAAS